MNNFNLTIKSGSGKFSKLDKLYRDFAINSINDSEEEYLDRWEVYNVIMNELIKIGEYTYFEEVKYRITDGENPNLVMLEMINKFFINSNLFFVLKSIIENFIDEDCVNRFI
jgi:hypothetical protein